MVKRKYGGGSSRKAKKGKTRRRLPRRIRGSKRRVAKARRNVPRLPPGTMLCVRETYGNRTRRPGWWLNGGSRLPATMMGRHLYEVHDMVTDDFIGTQDYGRAEFYMNSMATIYAGSANFDATTTPSGAYQPTWRDFMVNMYTRYCVIRSKMTVRFTALVDPLSTNEGVYCALYRDSRNAGDTTYTPTTPEDLEELKLSSQQLRYVQLGPGREGQNSRMSAVLEAPVYLYSDTGIQNRGLIDATSYAATPTFKPKWYIVVLSAGDVNSFNVKVDVRIEFETLWSNRLSSIGADV